LSYRTLEKKAETKYKALYYQINYVKFLTALLHEFLKINVQAVTCKKYIFQPYTYKVSQK